MRTRTVLTIALLVVACTSARPGAVRKSSVVADLDTKVRACDDFYQFANGTFLASNPVPPAFSRWGRSEMLRQQNNEILRQILEDASAQRTTSKDPDVRKLGAYYSGCMDEARIARDGVVPIAPILDRVNAIRSSADIEPVVAWLHSHGIMSPLFVFGSSSDLHDPNQDMAELHQGGRGLPERSYYFEQDEKSKGIRDAYVAHVAALLRLGGEDEARASRDAQSAMKIETALAQGSMSRAELRNPDAVDHPMSREELRALAPHFDWDDYFRVMGAPEFTRINVSQPEFVRAIDRQIESADVDEWKGYLRWRVLTAVADQLPGALEAEDFAFYGKTLAGRQENYPRWRRCVDAADGALGDALGRLYVARAFPPSAKAHAQQMIDNLIAALRSDIAELQWMSPATREKAAEKLARYKIEIGYPSRWRDYGALDVADAPYVTNAMAASSFEIHRTIAKIGKLRDKTEWEMNPHEVNAYNSPTLNSITFPAGILQPPFFDPNGDDGYNYGGMGAVIGHEIIHGFDDEGRRFDALGNLHDWWQPDDSKQFDTRASCVSNQFSSYVVGDVHVNGNLVLGESIADLGGLKIAYAAYQRSLASKGRAVVDGFTPEQRFFLGWARIWATSATPESERLQTTANEHPVSRFRVNGPMSNMPEFAAAFQCAAGTSMVRAERCTVW